jgi:Na+-driven multidrug efflux pump
MSESKANDFLEHERLGKLMVRYCVPCVIALVVATLYNIVDQLFIANASYLGVDGVAASTWVFPLTVIALGVGMMIGDGCCTFVSINLGAKENKKARQAVGTAVIALICLGLIFMVLYLVLQDQILGLFGGTKDNARAFSMAKEYFTWISIGIPFYMFGQAMNPIVRSDGSPRFAMATLLTGAVINIILDPIFIFGLKWGMTGAALATILGQIVSALMFAGYLFQMKAMKLDRDCFRFRMRLLGNMARMGMASLLTQVSIALSMAVVQSALSHYGAADPVFSQESFMSIPTAVFGIVLKFYQIIMSIAIGLATGIIPISGYNIGAKRYDRVVQLFKRLLLVEAIVGAVATVIFLGLPSQLTALFGGNSSMEPAVREAYMDYSVRFLRIFMCTLIISCVNKGNAIFQQSIGKAKTATVLSMMREILFGITMPVIMPIFFGLAGIPYFMPVSDVVAFIVAIFVIANTVKTLRRAQGASSPAQPQGDADPATT